MGTTTSFTSHVILITVNSKAAKHAPHYRHTTQTMIHCRSCATERKVYICVCLCVCVCAYICILCTCGYELCVRLSHVTISGMGWCSVSVWQVSTDLTEGRRKAKKRRERLVRCVTGEVLHSEGKSRERRLWDESNKKKRKKRKKRTFSQFGDPLLSPSFFRCLLTWPSPSCVGPDGLQRAGRRRACSPPPISSLSWDHMTESIEQSSSSLPESNSPGYPGARQTSSLLPFSLSSPDDLQSAKRQTKYLLNFTVEW